MQNYTIFVNFFCKKWCSITPSGNTVRQHQCGKQARAWWPDCAQCTVFCQTLTKSCQSTNNIAKILPKFCKISSIKRFILTMDPIIIVLPQVTPAKCEINKFRGQDPRKKWKGQGAYFPRFRHLCELPFLDHKENTKWKHAFHRHGMLCWAQPPQTKFQAS